MFRFLYNHLQALLNTDPYLAMINSVINQLDAQYFVLQ